MASGVFSGLRSLSAFRWRVARGIACGLALATSAALPAQELTEYALKAAFVYNFAKFTEWPKGSLEGPLTLCVFGADPYGETLDDLAGRLVQTHPLAIVREVDIAKAGSCHLLLIGDTSPERQTAILKQLARQPVLTIGDSTGFLQSAGMIELTMVNNRVQFSVNLDAVRAARLQISAQLLKLAWKVTGIP